MANELYDDEFYDKSIRAAVSATIVSKKANVCPFTVRLAWHASGTYDQSKAGMADQGGSNGATMRFVPEITDDANAGLALMQDILKPLQVKFPELSYADLWTLAGVQAIKLTGGPDVPFSYGRTDETSNAKCPANGRLPDAKQGAQHLRDVFYRMGFDDKAIVALSGAHTLGSCHRLRSGFDGPWTTNPLKFDNEYYRNLLEMEWTPREWDGPLQYTDPSGTLMMLPTDLALIQDESFLQHVKVYAANEALFFKDFAEAFGALLAKGCPDHCVPKPVDTIKPKTPKTAESSFRDLAMHGSLERMKELYNANAASFNVNSVERHSNRTALHKAAYFGHAHVVQFLCQQFQGDIMIDSVDADGDTALHDAARFGHVDVVTALLDAKANRFIVNLDGKIPIDLARANDKPAVVDLLLLDKAIDKITDE